MKSHSVPIDQRQIDLIFSPIRNKADLIKVLMRAIKILLVQKVTDVPKPEGEIRLIVSKMSRVFFFSKDKYFSINFPFSVGKTDDGDFELFFYTQHISDIGSKITSDVLALIADTEKFSANDALEFVEPILDLEASEKNIWPFCLELFMYDDGYIRYDYDEKNEKAGLHPLNHYDVFYTSKTTFKIGLKERLEKKRFIDLVDTQTDCHFID